MMIFLSSQYEPLPSAKETGIFWSSRYLTASFPVAHLFRSALILSRVAWSGDLAPLGAGAAGAGLAGGESGGAPTSPMITVKRPRKMTAPGAAGSPMQAGIGGLTRPVGETMRVTYWE